MTTYSTEDASAILEHLRTEGTIVPLTDPVAIGNLLAAIADAYHNVAAHAAEQDARLVAVRQAVFPLLRNPGTLGDLARTIDAEADPQQHPAA